MFLHFNIFLIFLCCLYGDVNCKCDVVPIPSIRKILASNDYLGAVSSTWFQSYSASLKSWPISDENCQPRLFTAGKITIKYSLRPKGCCTYCCPIDPVENDVFFYIEHKNKTRTTIHLADEKQKGKLAAAGVDNKLKTILLIHGYAEDGLVAISGKMLSQALLRKNESCNILRIDYSNLTPLPWYVEAVENTKPIAKAVAEFVIFYHKTGELPIENIYIIGISLGAQIAGLLGKEIGKIRKIPRITGLDPAFPLFSAMDKSQRLSKDDADFVDIIHTDPGHLGFPNSTGHADFYINYNNTEHRPRPGCNLIDLADGGALIAFIICDHLRSLLLYVETLDDSHSYPIAAKIPYGTTAGYMGYLASKTTTIGDYYLTINNNTKRYEYFLDTIED